MHDFQSFFYNVSHGLSLSFAAGHTKTADLMLSKDVCILHYETEKKIVSTRNCICFHFICIEWICNGGNRLTNSCDVGKCR